MTDGSLVIVISAWHEGRGMRCRVVHGDIGRPGVESGAACGSIGELMATVRAVLDAWDRVDPTVGT